MIALDSNIILRALTGDNAPQARTAQRVIETAQRAHTLLYISDAVLCEVAWVLKRQNRAKRGDVAHILREIVETEKVVVDDSRQVEVAIDRYEHGRGDFADYLICERALGAGATEVVTFDRALRGEPGFRVLGS